MLEKIIRTYYDAIFCYCYHSVGNRAVAEDLCQDTFASFIGHYGQMRNLGKAKNYLYTIAKNKCKDYYKKKAPVLMETVPEREKEECMEELVIVRQMIMSLPEAFREAVVLRYFQNLKYPEIADWIFLMKQGQFIAQGTLETLKEHYFSVTHSEGAEAFNLEKLYLFYFAEDEGYDAV